MSDNSPICDITKGIDVVMLAEDEHFPYLRSPPDIIVRSGLSIICDL